MKCYWPEDVQGSKPGNTIPISSTTTICLPITRETAKDRVLETIYQQADLACDTNSPSFKQATLSNIRRLAHEALNEM